MLGVGGTYDPNGTSQVLHAMMTMLVTVPQLPQPLTALGKDTAPSVRLTLHTVREGKGREGKGREGKGREGKGREGKGRLH